MLFMASNTPSLRGATAIFLIVYLRQWRPRNEGHASRFSAWRANQEASISHGIHASIGTITDGAIFPLGEAVVGRYHIARRQRMSRRLRKERRQKGVVHDGQYHIAGIFK